MSSDSRISQLPQASLLTGAELIPIVQNGNTQRATVQQLGNYAAQIQQWFNIKTYGAAGDGVTNDSAALSAAVAAAAAVGGGIVYVPSGTYFLGNNVSYTLSKIGRAHV